jgi:ketosteroid isomerase-like protein
VGSSQGYLPGMSREQVEYLLESMAAWNRGDFDAWLQTFHEDAEWIPYITAMETASYRGHPGLTRMWEVIHEEFESMEVRPERPADLGDRLLTKMEFVGVGRRSGLETRRALSQVATFRDGRILRIEMYADAEAAREAAGLRELEL